MRIAKTLSRNRTVATRMLQCCSALETMFTKTELSKGMACTLFGNNVCKSVVFVVKHVEYGVKYYKNMHEARWKAPKESKTTNEMHANAKCKPTKNKDIEKTTTKNAGDY